MQKSEVDGIWSRIQNQIDEVKPTLPAGSSEPELDKIKIKAYALITALTWQQDDKPNYNILNRQAEVLKDRIQAIAGTEEVELYGDRDEEILVKIERDAIASFGLGLFSILLFGYPFGFNPIIGTVGLIDVAINDSIIVLAAIQHLIPAAHTIIVRQKKSKHFLTTTLIIAES